MVFLLIFVVLAVALTRFVKVGIKPIIPLVLLSTIFIVLGKNQIDAGIYADAHQLSGTSVGWFHPYGMLVLGFVILALITDAIYILFTSRNRTKKQVLTQNTKS